jgi:predicted N-acetyltransferase YhbS
VLGRLTAGGLASVRIRTGRPDDAEALRELHRAASYVWEEDRDQLDAHPEVFGVRPQALAADQVRVAVLADGTPIGFATVRPASAQRCVLEDLFVEPTVMRTGVGRALVQDAVARAAADGHTTMSVVAAARTRGFYERLGFVVEGDAATQFGPALQLSQKLG